MKILKLLVGTFCYHFWSKSWPKRDRRGRSDLDSVTDEKCKANIVKTGRAIEAFMNFGCIATGILQLLSLKYSRMIWKRYRGWLRTITSEVPSEETVMTVIQESYFHNFSDFRNTRIYAIITAKKRNSSIERYRDVA